MKKITLLLTCIAISVNAFAQQTISFEASEGFTTGDINTQNGWAVTGCGDSCYIANQEISSEQVSTGTLSLKTAVDPAFGGQTGGPIMGGFYDFATPVPYATAVISYDIFITQQDANSSDFRFGVAGPDTLGDLFFTLIVDFDFQGNIKIIDAAGAFQNISTWSANTWYNVRAEVTGSNVVYFINDTQVGASVLLNDYDFTTFRFVHDNYGGDGFIDNIRINDEIPLSTKEFDASTITTFYNKQLNSLILESSNSAFTTIEVYDILGKRIVSKKLNSKEETINLETLQQGAYITKVSTLNGTKTIKFIKS
ncbi:T9SS type A sorting domain-containing protein [Lacinutrix algicola]|uniref:T9SS type A sorting domain-containing protein n=1 Tax=Lacinutrix algicola TaxID=342954 RepID=UPI0006E37709|nr:T9SS type A sorting domain-containing protein [Lacinutrix algicola]